MENRCAVALGGFMGAGKSTVGVELARRLGWPLVDTDSVLTTRFGPIHEQFSREGEQVFRARERDLIVELCDGQSRVLAVGGGVFAVSEHRARLRESYLLVTLQVPLDVLRQRVGADAERPLWNQEMAELYGHRQPEYGDVDLIVDATQPPRQVAEEIVQWLNRRS